MDVTLTATDVAVEGTTPELAIGRSMIAYWEKGPTRFAGPTNDIGRVSSTRTGAARAVNELGSDDVSVGGAGRRISPEP